MSGRDTSFYYSFLVLPARKRSAIVAVWDFCRAVDDAVDEVMPEDEWRNGLTPEARAVATEQLAGWSEELDAVYGGTPKTPQGTHLQPFVREFGLPKPQFQALIDGVRMDLEQERYASFDELAVYCRRVASAVGLICVEIFGYRNPAARDYAISLGLALQLTNIVRDVATDLRKGRIYLPTEDLERFGVTESHLRSETMSPQVSALLEFECNRARGLYAQAARQLPREDAGSLVAAEIMGGIYFAILERIERAGYDVFGERIRVPRPARAAIALRIWVRRLFR